MNQLLILIAVVIILIILYFYLKRNRKGGKKLHALWKECRRKLHLPPKIADETIQRYMDGLKKSHPNHTEEWYLEKIIYDLDRDRR